MFKRIFFIIFGLLLTGCSDDYERVYETEEFTMGHSLTYEMPILESDMLVPSSGDFSNDFITQTYESYWLVDHDHYVSEVKIGYELKKIESEYVPYSVNPMYDNIADYDYEVSIIKWEEINGEKWLYVESLPRYFESDDEEMIGIDHTYIHRAGFELYTYTFKVIESIEEYGEQEKLDNTYEEMERILSMAEFTQVPTMTETEISERLNGVWDGEGAGYLVFSDKDLQWYQDPSMSEDNVLNIELINVEAIIHPEEDIEYGFIELAYVTEVVNGEVYNSNTKTQLVINFLSENEIVLVDTENRLEYKLNKVE